VNDASRSAREHRLGGVIAEYRFGLFDRLLVIGVLGVVIALFFLLIYYLPITQEKGRWVERKSSPGSPLPFLLTALAVWAVVGTGFFLFSFRWPTLVLVFDEGMVCCQSARTAVYRWDEIREVQYSSAWIAKEWLYPTSPPSYTIRLHDGRQAVLPNWLRFRPLAGIIQSRTLDRLLKAALDDYDRGLSVRFGEFVSMDRAGLTIGKSTVPWPEVKEIKQSDKDGKIAVVCKGRWLNLSAGHFSRVPNHYVMLALVKQILANKVATD
jgi:hypothetical protein